MDVIRPDLWLPHVCPSCGSLTGHWQVHASPPTGSLDHFKCDVCDHQWVIAKNNSPDVTAS